MCPVGIEDRHGLGEGAAAVRAPHLGDGWVGCEELAELGDAAVVEEHLLGRLLTPLVADDDRQAGTRNEVGGLGRATLH